MRRSLLAIAALLLALVLVEGLARLRASSAGRAWSAREALFDAQALVTGMTESLPVVDELERFREDLPNQVALERNEAGGTILHPYAGFDAEPAPEMIDSTLAWQATRRRPEHLTVWVVGGSVAVNFVGQRVGVRDLLEQRLPVLARYAGREVRVVGFGRAGYKQPQQLTKLAYLLARGAEPDLVVNLDGYNEVHLGLANAEKGHRVSWPSHGHWLFLGQQDPLDETGIELLAGARVLEDAARAELDRARRLGLFSSAITGTWTLGRLRGLQRRWSETQERLVQHIDDAARARDELQRTLREREDDWQTPALEETVALWRRSSLLMHELCRVSGARYVHLLQPTLHDAGSKPVHPREAQRGLEGGQADPLVRRGYDLLRAAGEELRAAGVEFVDLSQAFAGVEEPLYYDRCHFVRRGNELVLDGLLAALDD